MAQNGYAVLAIDFHGHGENRNPFSGGFAENDVLQDDLKAAVDYLRNSRLVDTSRIVVMGRSMGGGAPLDYATHNPNLAGSVMISRASSGFSLWGPERPRNTLFIFAEHDLDFLRTLSMAIAGHLAGAAPVELGKTYGDSAKGDAVKAVRVPGVDHVEILLSDEAATKIIQWLDNVTEMKRTGKINLSDPRRRTSGIALLLFLLLLVPFGRIIGRLAPTWEQRAAGLRGWIGLGALAVALAAAALIVSIAPAERVALFVCLNDPIGITGADLPKGTRLQ